jgi:hypothetical protein
MPVPRFSILDSRFSVLGSRRFVKFRLDTWNRCTGRIFTSPKGLLLKWRSDPNLELNLSRTHAYALRSVCSAANSIGAEVLNHGSKQQSAGRKAAFCCLLLPNSNACESAGINSRLGEEANWNDRADLISATDPQAPIPACFSASPPARNSRA